MTTPALNSVSYSNLSICFVLVTLFSLAAAHSLDESRNRLMSLSSRATNSGTPSYGAPQQQQSHSAQAPVSSRGIIKLLLLFLTLLFHVGFISAFGVVKRTFILFVQFSNILLLLLLLLNSLC